MLFDDPRIKGRLRELLAASVEELSRDLQQSQQLAADALEFARKAKNPFETAVASIQLAYAETILGNYDAGLKLAAEVKKYSEEAAEFRLLTLAYLLIGISHMNQGNLDLAEQMYLAAAQLCTQHHIQDILMRVLGNLAPIYRDQGRLQEALNIAYRMQDLIENTEPAAADAKDRMFDKLRTNDILAILYDDLGDTQSALGFVERSLEIALKCNWTNRICNGYRNLGQIYFKQGRYDEAVKNYLMALEGNATTKNLINEIGYLVYLCECYLAMGELAKAEEVIERAWRLCSRSGDNKYLADTLHLKGKIKLARNDPESITLFLEALDVTNRVGITRHLEEIFEDIGAYYKGIGDYEHALQYHERYLNEVKKTSDERQRTFTKVHARHESERIEQEKKIFQLELDRKQAELTMQTTQLISQTDLLARLRNELRGIVREIETREPAVLKLKEKLKELPCESINWPEFDQKFMAVHPDFPGKLKERHPELSRMEARICALVRLKLRSSDISRLLCLSERTVDNHRHHIRKKLTLGPDVELYDYLRAM